MSNLQELAQAKSIIESFAPERMPSRDKPYRIGTRRVAIWMIPVSYIPSEQLIEVRLV